jgi:hypothetical protein
VRGDKLVELFGPPLNLDSVADAPVPQLRDQGSNDHFPLLSRPRLKEYESH